MKLILVIINRKSKAYHDITNFYKVNFTQVRDGEFSNISVESNKGPVSFSVSHDQSRQFEKAVDDHINGLFASKSIDSVVATVSRVDQGSRFNLDSIVEYKDGREYSSSPKVLEHAVYPPFEQIKPLF